MRRTLAVAALAAALFAAAACGDDGDRSADPAVLDGGATSNQAICDATVAGGDQFAAEFQTAGAALATALTTGDQTGVDAALAELEAAGTTLAQTFRDNAGRADDPALSAALTTLAGELEALSASYGELDLSDPTSLPDMAGFEAAGAAVGQICEG